MDGENRVPGVVFLVEQRLEFGLVQPLGEGRETRLDFLEDRLTFLGQFEEDFEILLVFEEAGQKSDFLFEALFFLLEADGSFLILPNFRQGEVAVQNFEAGFFGRKVKENLGARRI
jgi:hypothetical protein